MFIISKESGLFKFRNKGDYDQLTQSTSIYFYVHMYGCDLYHFSLDPKYLHCKI